MFIIGILTKKKGKSGEEIWGLNFGEIGTRVRDGKHACQNISDSLCMCWKKGEKVPKKKERKLVYEFGLFLYL